MAYFQIFNYVSLPITHYPNVKNENILRLFSKTITIDLNHQIILRLISRTITIDLNHQITLRLIKNKLELSVIPLKYTTSISNKQVL